MPGIKLDLLEDARLFRDICRIGRLMGAWEKVRSNGGAAGGDGISIQRFDRRAPKYLSDLSERLRSGRYRPGPLRRVSIPKRNGSLRTLSIPCVLDRIAQTSVHNVLSPLLDKEFEETSFAYRSGKGVMDAVRQVDTFRKAGFTWVVDADIEAFFDQVPHDMLMERLAESLTRGPLTELIALWVGMAGSSGRGLPQGSPLSPLLANLFLDRADEALSGRDMKLVRYADDFVILSRSRAGADAARDQARNALSEIGLSLHPEKTRVVSFAKGFRFLGHLFVRSMILKTADPDSGTATDQALLEIIAEQDEKQSAHTAKTRAKRDHQLAAGYVARFRVLHVHSRDRRVDVRNTAFSVQSADGIGEGINWSEILAIPHQDIGRIDVYPDAEITPAALRHALNQGVLVAWVNGHGETIGYAETSEQDRAKRHLAQAAAILDEDRRLDLAKTLIEGRIRNQRAQLRRLNRKRKDPEIVIALEQLNRSLARLKHAETLPEAMGHEGRAAALYWPAYSRCLPAFSRFQNRERRAGRDAANIVLDFTSSLLARDARIVIQRAGLHSGFSVLHSVADNRDSLVFDLIEEFRAPLSEAVTAYLFNNEMIKRDSFQRISQDQITLKSEAGQQVISTYEKAAQRVVKHPVSGKPGPWRSIMLEQAYAFAKCVEDGSRYRPVTLDY